MASSRDDTDAVLRRLEEIGDEDGVFRALLSVSRLDFYEGNCSRALAVCQRLFEPARSRSFRDRDAVAQGIGSAALFGPVPVDEAISLLDQAGRLVPGSITSDAGLGSARGVLLAMQGRADEARAEMARALGLWEELGNPGAMATTFMTTGLMELTLGQAEGAERGYRQGVDLLDRLGETGYNSTMLAGLAVALCGQGRFDEAEDIARRSEELTAEGDFASEAGWREARSLILSSRAEHDAAIELADAAVGHVQPTDYLEMIGEAHEIRGDVLAASRRPDESRAAYDAALARYERKGIVPRIARIRERIAALAR